MCLSPATPYHWMRPQYRLFASTTLRERFAPWRLAAGEPRLGEVVGASAKPLDPGDARQSEPDESAHDRYTPVFES